MGKRSVRVFERRKSVNTMCGISLSIYITLGVSRRSIMRLSNNGKRDGIKMNIIQTKLQVLPIGATKVTDAYCANALEKEVLYLLSLQEGRLLAGFYENAGLRTSYTRYGGWESGLIGGHTLGHYLTALSQGAVNIGVPEENRAALYEKMKSIVDSLAECQAHSKGEKGFLWGAPPAKIAGVEAQFDNVERGKTNIKREA